MALVVFLKGVNVGGHRALRPSVLAKDLAWLNVVNVGAAGTFVVHNPIRRADLKAEVARRLPFESVIMICSGTEIYRLVSSAPFAGRRSNPKIIQFVSLMARRRELPAGLPLSMPNEREWCLKVVAWQGRFVVGLHRREMKALRCLAQLERLCGAPLATRNWQTFLKIAELVRAGA